MSNQPLRKQIDLPLLSGDDGEVVRVDITMRSIEVIERVWNKGLDSIIVELSGATNIKRYLIADVISQWVPFGSTKLSQLQVKESVMMAPPEKFAMYAGLVLTVASYALHYLDEDGFTKAVGKLTEAIRPPGSAAPKAKRRRSPKAPTKS